MTGEPDTQMYDRRFLKRAHSLSLQWSSCLSSGSCNDNSRLSGWDNRRLLLMILGPQDRGPSRQCSGSGRVKGRDFPPLSEAPVSSMTSPPARSKADTFRNSPGSLPTTTPAQGTSYRRPSPHQPCKVTSSSFHRFYIEENGEFRPCPNHSSGGTRTLPVQPPMLHPCTTTPCPLPHAHSMASQSIGPRGGSFCTTPPHPTPDLHVPPHCTLSWPWSIPDFN